MKCHLVSEFGKKSNVSHASFLHISGKATKEGAGQGEEAGRETTGSHAASHFQHNRDIGQLHFSPEHLRQIWPGGPVQH